jgi:hypothetical protein
MVVKGNGKWAKVHCEQGVDAACKLQMEPQYTFGN